MNTSKPSLITAEEAVALMINMPYIPTGFTLLDMTAAYVEEAQVAYDNARVDRLPSDQLETLIFRLDACEARHSLAQAIMEDLKQGIDNHKDSGIIIGEDSYIQPRLTLESVSNWAFDKYGIGISEESHADRGSNEAGESVKNIPWEDVTIKIY